MAVKYQKEFGTNFRGQGSGIRDQVSGKTFQVESIPDSAQVKNNAGDFVWKCNKWQRLERFLVLGSEGGAYYVSEQKLIVGNAQSVIECMKEDGRRTIDTIISISESSRALKNDPALFALAICAGLGDLKTKSYALSVLPRIARIPTHLFSFLTYIREFRGWGRALRRAVADWYNNKPLKELAYQCLKYQQRNGWSNRDVLRLSHPHTDDWSYNFLYKYITHGSKALQNLEAGDSEIEEYLIAYESLNTIGKPGAINLIRKYKFTHEFIPTRFLWDCDIWGVLLEHIPIEAIIRNLGNMTKIGLLKPGSKETQVVVNKISNRELIYRSRLHPIKILVALLTYKSGKGYRGSGSWTPLPQIIDALDRAFYISFGNIEPTNKRLLLALDNSISMTFSFIAGLKTLSAEIASAAMALIIANTESQCTLVGFHDSIVPLSISPKQKLDDVCKNIDLGHRQSDSDCALPILYALEEGIKVDAFIIFTDNETQYRKIHPTQALASYRRKMNIPAKLVVVGMIANQFSIADPNDPGMLDVVGFDIATPRLISNFIMGDWYDRNSLRSDRKA